MTEKEILEINILKKIDSILYEEKPSFSQLVSLVEFSRDNDLFFPQLYQFWFTTILSKHLIETSAFSLIKKYSVFYLSEARCNEIIAKCYENLVFVTQEKLIDENYRHTLADFFLDLLDFGVFFDDDFWGHEIIISYFDTELQEHLRVHNIENRKKYLEHNLEIRDTTSLIKI